MRKFIGVSLGSLAVYALPFVTSAQSGTGVGDFLQKVAAWMNTLVGIVMVIAVLVFFWGLVKYLTAVGEEKHNGLLIMFYGVLTIFVMVSLWGLVYFFAGTLGGQVQQGIGANAPEMTLPKTNPH